MLESIISALRSTDPAGSFCTKITAPHKNLHVRVDPIGRLEFPISERAAKSLIVEASPAKFGKGSETLFDRKVRDAWEIPGHRIEIGPEWNTQFTGILKKVQAELGLPDDGKLRAELHNMLIYMPGQFFKSHQDSEKTDGMIGTMVFLLPSPFSGGDLVIDQHGDKRKFPAPHDMQENLTCIAFYADCRHQAKEVASGFRIALTYNLVFSAPANPTLAPCVNEKLEARLAAYFSKTAEQDGALKESGHPRWFVYLLDHEYTQRSLSWQGLRGADRQRIAEFMGGAERLELTAHLALADIHETWSTEDLEYHRGRRYGRRKYWSEEDNEAEVNDSANYELIEMVEDDVELRHWIDREGRESDLKPHSIPREMVCWTKAVDAFMPFRSEHEGYTGNAGNTLDRWYHRAAIVLWRKDFEFASLFVGDPEGTLQKIQALLKKDLEAGRAAVMQILPRWSRGAANQLQSSSVFTLASLVQSPDLASQLFMGLGLGFLNASSQPHFLKLADAYGEDWCLHHLRSWAIGRDWHSRDSLIGDLLALTKGFYPNYLSLCSWLLEHRMAEIAADDSSLRKTNSLREIKRRMSDRIAQLTDFLRAARLSSNHTIYDRAIQHILSYPQLYSAVQLVGVLASLHGSEGDASDNWDDTALIEELRRRLARERLPARAEADWSIQGSVPHDCKDCQYLKLFLTSVSQKKLGWPLAKDRRAHIHSVIESMDIAVTHETLHVGSPHKLVLMKTPMIALEKSHNETIDAAAGLLRRLSRD